jgi:hypothetical protein
MSSSKIIILSISILTFILIVVFVQLLPSIIKYFLEVYDEIYHPRQYNRLIHRYRPSKIVPHTPPSPPIEYIVVINPGNKKAIATKSYVVNVS